MLSFGNAAKEYEYQRFDAHDQIPAYIGVYIGSRFFTTKTTKITKEIMKI